MLVLLPPSETKRDGGSPDPLDLTRLAFPELERERAMLVDALERLAADADAMMRALKLGPRQAAEVDRNRLVRSAPTMPAIDRYTGVLYDALDAPTLDDAARAYAADHVMVHSALFGLVGALDAIPAYRLSHDSRLPGVRLKAHWRAVLAERLAAHRGLVVDLRSEGYAELGPLPARPDAVFVRVVADDGDGRRRALNHFNKQSKGRFVRALVASRPSAIASIDELVSWAAANGFQLDADGAAAGELQLVA